MTRCLFIYNPADLNSAVAGGVQKCTVEFYELLQESFDEVTRFVIRPDRSWCYRIRRASRLVPYSLYKPASYRKALISELEKGVDAIFLNKAELVRFTALIRKLDPIVPIVLMSHGNESGDMLLGETANGHASAVSLLFRDVVIGRILGFEARSRSGRNFKVLTISEEECVLERWLGTSSPFFLPRRIKCNFVDWRPEKQTVGFIGTLNHGPNSVALRQILNELSATQLNFSLEVIGGPEENGRRLASEFPQVRYLGQLPDHEARQIMGRWTVAINPVLWLSRGSSMKLATLISMGIPTVTSLSGLRGYCVPPQSVHVTTDDAREFAAAVVGILENLDRAEELRRSIIFSKDVIETTNYRAFQDWLGNGR